MLKIPQNPLFYCITLSLALTGAVVAGLFFAWSPTLIATLGVLYLAWNSVLLGRAFFGGYEKWAQVIFGVLAFVALLSSLGALIYFFWDLSSFPTAIILTLVSAITLATHTFLAREYPTARVQWKNFRVDPVIVLITLLFFAGCAFGFRTLLHSTTTEATRSPWFIVPGNFFFFYFLAGATLITLTSRFKKSLLLPLISLYAFLGVAVALLVYAYGYGFDPILHRATEKIIAETGIITPKPLYYLGQYALVVLLHKLLHISTDTLDLLLIPLSFAILLPTLIAFVFKHTDEKKHWLFAPIFFLTLPFGAFIATTPQALANIFFFASIFFGWLSLHKQHPSFLLLALLAIASVASHPISGIPAIFFLLLLFAVRYHTKHKIALLIGLSLLASLALPLAFVALARYAPHLGISFSWTPNGNITGIIPLSWPIIARKFQTVPDLLYTVGKNIPWYIAIFSVIGGMAIFKNSKNKHWIIFPLLFVIIALNALLVGACIRFTGLIAYEQGEYARRMWELAPYGLLPLFLSGLLLFIQKIQETKYPLLQTFFTICFGLLVTTSLFLSYPRYDDYEPTRGYNVSQADVEAVRAIDAWSPKPYVVLANQATAAASIREFGFWTPETKMGARQKYYRAPNGEEVFYYPIPTGGPLYELYLKMVYEAPTRETMMAAMNLAGVDVGYFVINDYWFDSKKIIEATKNIADASRDILNGKIWVFRFER